TVSEEEKSKVLIAAEILSIAKPMRWSFNNFQIISWSASTWLNWLAFSALMSFPRPKASSSDWTLTLKTFPITSFWLSI
ncbi:hypothetical protein B0F90DRAFT_1775403, partial [Multifurca ochricompacta]